MKILQLTVHFPPNVGGVETHLWDLATILSGKEFNVFVLCYQPLSAKVSWKIYEKYKKITIIRIPWVVGLFYKFIPHKILEFLYLFPGLFIITPFILVIENPYIIHAHGLVAGFVAIIWGMIFGKKVVISTHSLYSFPKEGVYKRFANFIFGGSDQVLCLSEKSCDEIINLGVNRNKVTKFTYWIDLNKFKKIQDARKKFNWKEKLIVLFVGRLIAEKGIEVLLDSVKHWNNNIGLVFAGTGPLEKTIQKEAVNNSRIHFLGKMTQNELPELYSAADVTIVPSVSEEGFGRVIMESLACSTPVVAANRGSIPEALDTFVGQLIDVSADNITTTVEELYKNNTRLRLLSGNARKFAERRFSVDNANSIIQAYRE